MKTHPAPYDEAYEAGQVGELAQGSSRAYVVTPIGVVRTMMEDASVANIPKQFVTENSYILDPESYGEAYVVRQDKLQKIILEALEQRLAGQVYDPVKGAQRAKQLADEIKERVKTLGNSRHKLIVQVLLGQKKGQASRVVSRCLWDVHSDTAASATYENETMYCVCQVYALYLE